MFKRGLKILFKLLALPVLMAGSVWALYEYGKYGLRTSIEISVTITGCLAIMWLWIGQIIQKSSIDQLRQGIHDHEASILKRINSVSANMASSQNVKQLEKEIALARKNTSTAEHGNRVISAEDAISPMAGNNNIIQSVISDDAKIIPLEAAKRNLQKPTNQENQAYSDAEIAELVLDGNLCIYLQPKVALLDNSLYGFEVLARLKDNNGLIIPACNFIKRINKPRILCELDTQILNKTIKLMRSLRRNGKQQLMHVNLSSTSVSNQESFDDILKKLNSNKSLRNFLVLEMSEHDFSSVTSKYSDRINEIMKLGFRFCIDNCLDASNAIRYMKSGMLSAVKISARTFHELDYWASIDSEMNLASQAKENEVKLIVTHVEKKRQVIQLIDNNVEIAQGFMFSEPKPPASSRKPKKALMPATKVARR